MLQLYFLSILFNGLIGYILFQDDSDKNETMENSLRFSIHNPTLRLALGILSAVTGILKLLSPIMNRVPILGDLVPALAGMAAGFALIYGVFKRQSPSSVIESGGKLDRVGESLLRGKKILGIGLMVVALLHFLFPEALFL